MVEDVRYLFVVKRSDLCWEIRENPFLTGDKGTCMDKHEPKSPRLTDGQTGKNGMRMNEHTRVRTRKKCILYAQQAVNE